MADVVDNDELIATRKLNGLDDDLFKKEKAKNKESRNNYEKNYTIEISKRKKEIEELKENFIKLVVS